MNWLPYYLIAVVWVFLLIGIARVEKKYDKKIDEINKQLEKLDDEIWNIKDNYGELEHRIDNLDSPPTSVFDNEY